MEIVTLTETAQTKARQLQTEQGSTRDGLRLKVVGGGCSGLAYSIGWDDVQETDLIHEYSNGLRTIVDPKSATLLAGSSMDYHDSLERSGFEITNPHAKGGCGCGKSFSA